MKVTPVRPSLAVRLAASVVLVPKVIALIPTMISDSAKDFAKEVTNEANARIETVHYSDNHK